ncbi:MAG: zinc ribbon domain-containing protein [Methylohalobius crimeensis]
MPIYEYRCQSCGHALEILQKVSDPPPGECPECHQNSLQKQVSAAAFRLKGGGWYETDFKKGPEKKRNLAGDSGDKSDKSDNKSSKKDKAEPTQSSKGKSSSEAA